MTLLTNDEKLPFWTVLAEPVNAQMFASILIENEIAFHYQGNSGIVSDPDAVFTVDRIAATEEKIEKLMKLAVKKPRK